MKEKKFIVNFNNEDYDLDLTFENIESQDLAPLIRCLIANGYVVDDVDMHAGDNQEVQP